MNYDGNECPICHNVGLAEQPIKDREYHTPKIKNRGKNAGKFLGILVVIVLGLIAVPVGIMFLDNNFLAIIPKEGRDLVVDLREGINIENPQQPKTEPSPTSQDDKQPLEIIPKIPNFFDDGILTYNIDPIPSKMSQTSMIKQGVYDGLSMWSKKNPELVFQEITSGKPDIQISWIEYQGKHSGMGCIDCLDVGATIEVVLEELDCNGKPVQYDKGTITNIVAHEFGHNLGLEHHRSENLLMWSDIDPKIPYDDLGYNIPNRVQEYFLGYKELQDKYELLQKEIEKLGKEHDTLSAKYDQFPEVTRTNAEYQYALQTYNELTAALNKYNDKKEESNQLVEVMNCFPNTII